MKISKSLVVIFMVEVVLMVFLGFLTKITDPSAVELLHILKSGQAVCEFEQTTDFEVRNRLTDAICCSNAISDRLLINQEDNVDRILIGRKLKEDGHSSYAEKGSGMGSVGLEDYHPVDPPPSSKASVKPGPIEHGTPLIPYIPVPLPPSPSPPTEGG